MLPLPTLHTSADGRTVADDVRQQKNGSHLPKQSKWKLPLTNLLTSAAGRTGADDVRKQMIVSYAAAVGSATPWCTCAQTKKKGLFFFSTAGPGWAPAIAGHRTQLEPFFCTCMSGESTCCCRHPDAAHRAWLQMYLQEGPEQNHGITAKVLCSAIAGSA